MERRYLEFFAGGGMVRAALEPAGWTCVFANDLDRAKAAAYRRNWGRDGDCPELAVGDVRGLDAALLPDAELAWASFPCQDLSLAGAGAGLGGERSGTFFPFWRLVRELRAAGRAPGLVALENVTGALTSHGGADFAAICAAFAEEEYAVGALVVDAALFVPQSRPRLFVVGVAPEFAEAARALGLTAAGPVAASPFHPPALVRAVEGLGGAARAGWIWWRLPVPPPRTTQFADLLEDSPPDVRWFSAEETAALLDKMSDGNREKLAAARRAGRRVVGTVYKRTRPDGTGTRRQRAEARFDGVAGCLRTPAGGSSRQIVLVVDGDEVRARLISARETARLMGLPETYELPARYNEAYHLTGDGVAVPAVAHLAHHLFAPLLARRLAACRSNWPP